MVVTEAAWWPCSCSCYRFCNFWDDLGWTGGQRFGNGYINYPDDDQKWFTKNLSGGVEAAASSGGQIMPPVMGIAAFVLAALSTVPYSEVIIAAFIPAVAYFLAFF